MSKSRFRLASCPRRVQLLAFLGLPLLVLSARAAESPSPSPKSMTENPLLKESTLDFHYPPFDQIKDEHFAPAYEQGMAEQLKEIEPIASNPEPPTFENTIVALEKTGVLLERVDRIFSNLASANTNPTLQKVETEMAPKLAAQRDAIYLNGPLFKRVETLYNERAKLGLDEESTMAGRALLQGFRARRRQAFRRGQDQAQADERGARRSANEVFAERPQGKKCRGDCGRQGRGSGWLFADRTGSGARGRERGQEGRQVCHSRCRTRPSSQPSRV